MCVFCVQNKTANAVFALLDMLYVAFYALHHIIFRPSPLFFSSLSLASPLSLSPPLSLSYLIAVSSYSHQEIVRLNVSMNEVLIMNIFYPSYHLKGKGKRRGRSGNKENHL